MIRPSSFSEIRSICEAVKARKFRFRTCDIPAPLTVEGAHSHHQSWSGPMAVSMRSINSFISLKAGPPSAEALGSVADTYWADRTAIFAPQTRIKIYPVRIKVLLGLKEEEHPVLD